MKRKVIVDFKISRFKYLDQIGSKWHDCHSNKIIKKIYTSFLQSLYLVQKVHAGKRVFKGKIRNFFHCVSTTLANPIKILKTHTGFLITKGIKTKNINQA